MDQRPPRSCDVNVAQRSPSDTPRKVTSVRSAPASLQNAVARATISALEVRHDVAFHRGAAAEEVEVAAFVCLKYVLLV
jgi:hypothetical protein